MSRISAFKNKINRLVGENINLAMLNISKQTIILKHRENAKVLRDKIIDMDIKIIEYEESSNFQYFVAREKEIMKLKKEGQCKQITIDSLEFDADRNGKRFKNATEIIIKLNNDIQDLEDKKIKNRLKKLFVS